MADRNGKSRMAERRLRAEALTMSPEFDKGLRNFNKYRMRVKVLCAQTDLEAGGPRSWRRARDSGGEGGIRTLDTVSRIHAFQACAFNHSATSPLHGEGVNSTIGAEAPAEGLHSSV